MSDIQKIAIYDDRIVQKQMKYGISKGAVSVTAGIFNAIAANSSQMTFQLTSPSENVFIDRSIDWTSDVFIKCSVAVGGTLVSGQPILRIGLDAALCMFPLNSLVSTLTATINDATVTSNSSDTLYEVLRLTDSAENREMRTCPYAPDLYKSYNDGYLATNSPLNGFNDGNGSDYVPNGAFKNVYFTKADGTVLTTADTTYNDGLNNVDVSGGVPRVMTGITAYNIYLKFTSTEKIVLSPFIFADSEQDTGLFSIQNISFVMNMNAPSLTNTSGRVLRSTTSGDRTVSALSYNNSVTGGTPFTNARINCVFLTPSLSIPLPPKSLVPMMEFPRYNSTFSTQAITALTTKQISSQTITLSCIPDFLIIYVKPTAYTATDGDYYHPITKVSINFDNYSGLLSSHSTEALYKISNNNGLKMSYNQWSGLGRTAKFASGINSGLNVPLTGGFLVLKPGIDFALSTGLAPGMIGNFTFQCDVTVFNQTAATINDFNLWVIAASSGFFESQNGSSRIIKGAYVTAEEVINATTSDSVTRSELNRVVGGASFSNMMSNAMSKVPQIISGVQQAIPIFKQVAPIVKPFLPAQAKSALTAIGMGSTGGARTGGARSLSSRLM
nr:MAG: putative major capsid protein [Lake Baikal virophage 16]